MGLIYYFAKNGSVQIRVRNTERRNGRKVIVSMFTKTILNIRLDMNTVSQYESLKTVRARERFLQNNPSFHEIISRLEDLKDRLKDTAVIDPLLLSNTIISLFGKESVLREHTAISGMKSTSVSNKYYQTQDNNDNTDLTSFICSYVKSIMDGTRKIMGSGKEFSVASRGNIARYLGKFLSWQKEKKIRLDFEDITLDVFQEYLAWLSDKNYKANTIYSIVKQLKTVLAAAETRGYPVNPAFRSREFKTRQNLVDTIYLTREELQRIEDLDLSNDPKLEKVRDVFFIGVWTAQRVSDYSNIGIEQIKTIEYGGKTITYLSIRQKKTGAQVNIPCNSKLRVLLYKYRDGMPYSNTTELNDGIKKIGKMAGIVEDVIVNEIRGGRKIRRVVPKYKLIVSHTARRTGATLMYLSGMEIFDIMKVTGHTSIESLTRYIRATQLEVVQTLATKYNNYFD